jgi:hypothetical protein
MKKISIFAANTPSSFYRHEIAVAIFMFDLLLSAKIKGYRFHNGLLHSCCNLNLAVRGAVAFLILITLFFCYMPSSTKNASNAKDSSVQARLTHETGTSLFHSEYIDFTKQLGTICKWFSDYRKTVNPNDDHVLERLTEIDNNLCEAVHNIADLVAIEFQENAYYKEL